MTKMFQMKTLFRCFTIAHIGRVMNKNLALDFQRSSKNWTKNN